MFKKMKYLCLLLPILLCSCGKQEQTYTITFMGANNQTIEVSTFTKNSSIQYPIAPTIEGYTFIKWDTEISQATKDMTIYALYEKKQYTITFMDSFGTVLESTVYAHLDEIVYPKPEEITGYTFIGYDDTTKQAKQDKTITLQYQKCNYRIRFINSFGDLIEEKEVAYQDIPVYPDAPPIEGYDFIGFSENPVQVTGDQDIILYYEKKTYDIRFMTEFGEEIETVSYPYHSEIIYPTAPSKEGYQFHHWDSEEQVVTREMTIIAYYTQNQYTVVFMGRNDCMIETYIVNYQDQLTYPQAPYEKGYTFIRWDQSIDLVTENLIIHAIYQKDELDIHLNQIQVTNHNTQLQIVGSLSYNESIEWLKWIIWIDDTCYNVEVEGSTNMYYPFEWFLDLIYDETTVVHIDIQIQFEEDVFYPLYEDDYFCYIEPAFSSYTSYVENLSLASPANLDLTQFEFTGDDCIATLSNVIYGGFRGTNECHVYDEATYRNRNAYGYEIAVDKDGIAIDAQTLVDLPKGGCIISGHGTAATLLEKQIQVGDYIQYHSATKQIQVYRAASLNQIIWIRENLIQAKEKMIASYIEKKPLDYALLQEKYQQALEQFAKIDALDSSEKEQLALLVSQLHYLTIAPKTVEVKAFWHYPMRITGYPENTTLEVCKLLDRVVELGINTIYVNTNFNGGSIYPSAYLRQQRGANYVYEGYNDYLECFIEEAHRRNLRVVAWSNTFVCGDGYLPSYNRRDFCAIDYQGNYHSGNVYFYDITQKEVQTLLTNVYKELSHNYNLDGIEYDFVRYPASNLHTFSGVITDSSLINDFCYTESALNLFQTTYQIEGDVKTLLLTSEDIRKQWMAFKVQNVTNMVKMISNVIHSEKPHMMISTAVMSSLSGAIQTYAQDFGTWIKEGYVDNLDPMIYSGSNSYVASRIEGFMETVNGQASIVIGLSPDNSGGDAITLCEQLEYISNHLEIGFSEFSSRNIFNTPEIIVGLQALKRSYTVTPYQSKEEIRKAYALHMLDVFTNYYCHIDQSIDVEQFKKAYGLLWSNQITYDEISLLIGQIQDATIAQRVTSEWTMIQNLLEENR
ncbi:MAG: family 10 glycosylhydrolase [Anaeroplasma bactoclasticum]|nr:family 10 glycosylhydrolase [Anaeroplasma bactoclasticum]